TIELFTSRPSEVMASSANDAPAAGSPLGEAVTTSRPSSAVGSRAAERRSRTSARTTSHRKPYRSTRNISRRSQIARTAASMAGRASGARAGSGRRALDGQDGLAEQDAVACAEHDLRHAVAVDPSAVGRAEIGQHEHAVAGGQPRVA